MTGGTTNVNARHRDPEATRAAILDAAEEVIVAKGFAEASTAEIARRAGVTKSLIHHYFGSKEGLWAEAKMRRFSEYASVQLAMIEGGEPDASLLRESMRTYFRFLQQNPQIARMLAWMFLEPESTGDPECAALDRELAVRGIEKIRQGQEEGAIRADLSPGFILFTFLGICQHWFQDKAWMLGHIGLSPESSGVDDAYLEDAVKIFFEGVLPR